MITTGQVDRWARRRAHKVVGHPAGCICRFCAAIRVRVKRACRARLSAAGAPQPRGGQTEAGAWVGAI